MVLKSLPSKPGIYQIVNKTTQKRYIGLSQNINKRITDHFVSLRFNRHPNNHLQNAFNKYGINDFYFSVLELCKSSDLYKVEDYWVRVYNTNDKFYGYNLKPTDPDGKSKHSAEAIKKISQARKGKPYSDSERNKRKLSSYVMTKEHIIAAAQGREKAFESIGTIRSKYFRSKIGKKIINTVTGEIYNSLKDLCEKYNLKETTISHKLSGSRKNNTEFKYV